ncbi:MAG: four helix bundle protein [Cyclobacteriaceae bacterium]|nr:four helix bundle protein [Cyclobacteriaceae bacterium]
MFDFEKLEVYQHVNQTNVKVLKEIEGKNSNDPYLYECLKKATVNILLNLSEGTGRITPKDKNEYYTMARSAVFESVAILNLLREMGHVEDDVYHELYDDYERCSKMLLGMLRSYSQSRSPQA